MIFLIEKNILHIIVHRKPLRQVDRLLCLDNLVRNKKVFRTHPSAENNNFLSRAQESKTKYIEKKIIQCNKWKYNM